MEPPVRIRVNSCARGSTNACWRVGWRLTNLLREPLLLQDAWVPHGRFRGEGHIALHTSLAAGADHDLALNVLADEAPGTVVENAFLIVQMRSATQGWRVFARMKVVFGDVPTPTIEAVTAQPL